MQERCRAEGRNVIVGTFAPLASFALFHMVTVFPLSWVFLFTQEGPGRFLIIETIAAAFGVAAIVASGPIADRLGRRTLLGRLSRSHCGLQWLRSSTPEWRRCR